MMVRFIFDRLVKLYRHRRRLIRVFLALTAVFLCLYQPGVTVTAMSPAQQQIFDLGIGSFNVNPPTNLGSTTCGDTSGSSNTPSSGNSKVGFLAEWELQESGGGGGEYNPYNYSGGNFPNFNSNGVKNYPDYQTGIKETVAFFNQNNMSEFLTALKSSSSSTQDLAKGLNDFYASWGGTDMGTKVASSMNGVDLTRTIPSMPGHNIGQFANDLMTALNGAGGASSCSGLTQTVLSFAWPTYHAPPYTQEEPGYAAAMVKSQQNHLYTGAAGTDGTPGIDCGGFVTTLMIYSGFEPNYNYAGKGGNTVTQAQWAKANWQDLGPATSINPANLQPGDVAISPDHTYVWVGDIPGFGSKIASASTGGTAYERSPMADTQQNPTEPGFEWFRKK